MKKNNLFKSRIIAALLVAMMVVSMAPVGLYSYAANDEATEVGDDMVVEDASAEEASEAPALMAAPATDSIADGDVIADGEEEEEDDGLIWYVWVNYDGTELYREKGEPGQRPKFPKATPKKPSDLADTAYQFYTWKETAGPEIDGKESVTCTAQFRRVATYQPWSPLNVTATPLYEKVRLTWKPNSNYGNRKVYYEIRRGGINGQVVRSDVTGTSYTAAYDPYPGDANGKGTSGVARKGIFCVRAYVIIDGKRVYSNHVTKSNIDIIHPMYVRVKAKRNAKMYASESSNTSVGTVKKGTQYIVIGGSRVNGEKKRVIIKVGTKNGVGGQLRYISSSDVTYEKMWYSSKPGSNSTAKAGYSPAAILNFINDRGLTSNPKKGPKRLIWVNTYNQRVYLFQMNTSTNKWAIYSDYPYGLLCNTGKELTPYGVFRVANKWAKKPTTGTKWWCIFHSVGIHEKLGDALGKPTSGGCVRIADAYAYRFYSELIKVGTTVFVY